MGLTESNQSKGGGGGGGGGVWGPSKSRSTPHFPDTRSYQGRPRQAATLPARPTPESAHPPPYAPRTPSHDPQPMGHDPRPPERASHREDYAHGGRSPCLRPMPPRRSASADSRKRRSDPLLDARTLRQLPQLAPLQRDHSPMSSSPRTPVTPPSTPRLVHRPRPTAIYLADDQAAHLVKQREGRSRDRSKERGHHGRGHSGGPRSRAPEERRNRSQGSGERRPRATHVTTLTLTPQYPGDSRPQTPMSDYQPRPAHHRRRKGNKKSQARTADVGSTERLQSDPYVCLHYGGSPKESQGAQAQQMTAWRSEYEQPGVPNSQVSQVVIRMNQVSDAALDNFDAVNANVESVQMRRNVWFHSNCISDIQGASTVKRSFVRTNATTSVCENSSCLDREQEIIQWPDVTSKVSSMYMRPEMHIAAVSCIGEEQKVTVYSNEGVGGGHKQSPSSTTSSHRNRGKSSRSSSGDKLSFSENGGSECASIVSWGEHAERPGEKALEDKGSARHFSIYDDRRNYSRAPGRRKKSPSGTRTNGDASLGDGQPASSYCVVADPHTSRRLMPDQEVDPETDSPPLPPRRGQDKAMVEVKFGFQNHVEDFTIIEDARDEGHYYGCGDSDVGEWEEEGEGEGGTASHEGNPSASLQDAHLSDTRKTLECSDACDNTSTFCDKVDKDTTTDSNSRGTNSCLSSLGRHAESSEGASIEDVMLGPDNGSQCQEGDQEIVEIRSSVRDAKSRPNAFGDADRRGAMFSEDSRVCLGSSDSYWSDTVSGSPSALLYSHKCLNHSTTLPRRQRALGRVADSGISNGEMKTFRNRFRSFDAGNFPVLRLPLGNQPKLVDVLRACAAKEASPPLSLDAHQTGSTDDSQQPDRVGCRRQSKADSIDHFYVDYLCDDAASWPQCDETAGAKAPSRGPGPDTLLGDEPSKEGLGDATADDARNIPDLPFGHSHDTHEASGASGGAFLAARDAAPPWGASSGQWVLGNARTWHAFGAPTGNSPELCAAPPRRGDSLVTRRKTLTADPGAGGARDEEIRPDTSTQGPIAFPHLARHGRKRAPSRPSVRAIAWDTPSPTPAATPSKPADCSYTCHEQCQDLVTLDCKADLTPDSHTSHEDLYVEGAEEPESREEGKVGEREEEQKKEKEEQDLEKEEEEEEEEEEQEEEEEEEEKLQQRQEEKHEEEQQEKELKDELLPFKKSEEVSTLRKTVSSLQSHLVDNDTLEAWVERYNASTQGLQIAKENDGSYRGCVRVHLNLSRPINIVAGTRPPSIYDILQEDRTMEKTLTSFYMPRDAVKAIHITSKTTTREVIVALLRKFKVVDNPQKFALYERTIDSTQSGKARLRRLGDGECPLVLALNWSAGGLTNKRLVLQENDTADIQWEAFSLPELSNFLRILDREEEEYRCQIQDKYALLRRRINNILIQQEAE